MRKQPGATLTAYLEQAEALVARLDKAEEAGKAGKAKKPEEAEEAGRVARAAEREKIQRELGKAGKDLLNKYEQVLRWFRGASDEAARWAIETFEAHGMTAAALRPLIPHFPQGPEKAIKFLQGKIKGMVVHPRGATEEQKAKDVRTPPQITSRLVDRLVKSHYDLHRPTAGRKRAKKTISGDYYVDLEQRTRDWLNRFKPPPPPPPKLSKKLDPRIRAALADLKAAVSALEQALPREEVKKGK